MSVQRITPGGAALQNASLSQRMLPNGAMLARPAPSGLFKGIVLGAGGVLRETAAPAGRAVLCLILQTGGRCFCVPGQPLVIPSGSRSVEVTPVPLVLKQGALRVVAVGEGLVGTAYLRASQGGVSESL